MRSRTFEKLGNMTRRQTATAGVVTGAICGDVLKRDLAEGGYMDLELKPAGNTFGEDAMRVVEIRRGQLRYRVEIYIKREA